MNRVVRGGYLWILILAQAVVAPVVFGAETETVSAKKGKVNLNSSIDNDDASNSTPVKYESLEEGKIGITSKTFMPPDPLQFIPFPGSGTHVDIQTDPSEIPPSRDADSSSAIKVSNIYKESNAGVFPLQAEGNMAGGSGPGEIPHWSAKMGMLNIDIARLGGEAVDQDIEDVEGSITKVLNPNLEDEDPESPNDTFGLGLINLKSSFEDKSGLEFSIELKPVASGAEIKIWKDGSEYSPGTKFEKSELSADYSVTFISGGIVDIELVAYESGARIGSDIVRAVGIACKPKSGSILYVNPDSSGDGENNDYKKTPLKKVDDGVKELSSNDNLVIADGTYSESNITVNVSAVISGLAPKWSENTDDKWDDNVEHRPGYDAMPVLDGSGNTSPILLVKANSVALGGMIIKGSNVTGKPVGGAGVRAIDVSGLEVCAVKFLSNKAPSGFGGGVYFGPISAEDAPSPSTSDIVIEDSEFEGNEAKDGGGVAAVSSTEVRFDRTAFKDNKSSINTGDNARGGAIVASKCGGNLRVDKCLFNGNTANDTKPGPDADMVPLGGVIPSLGVPRGYNITNLDVGAFGGAVSVWKGNPELFVGKSVFCGNIAQSEFRRGRGGAISIRDVENAAFVSGSQFGQKDEDVGNRAIGTRRASGGAIDLFTASADIEDAEFHANRAISAGIVNLPQPGDRFGSLVHVPDNISYGGAVALHHGGELTTSEECEFFKNTVPNGAGGAVSFVGRRESVSGEGSANLDFDTEQVVSLEDSHFESNDAFMHGGALNGASFLSGGDLAECDFVDNRAVSVGVPTSWEPDGGAVAYQTASNRKLVFDDCEFNANVASDGGGACKHGGISFAEYTNSRFIDNQAFAISGTGGGGGGAIRGSTLANIKIGDRTRFSGNDSKMFGGAISLNNSNLTVEGFTTFTGNKSTYVGGAVDAAVRQSGFGIVDGIVSTIAPSIQITDSSFAKNSTSTRGGALSVRAVQTTPTTRGSTATTQAPAGINSIVLNCVRTQFTDNTSASFAPGINGDFPIGVFGGVDGVFLVTEVRQYGVISNFTKCQFTQHRGMAVLALNGAVKTDVAPAAFSNCTFVGNGYGIISRHADIDTDLCLFSTQGMGVAGSTPRDIAVLDAPALFSDGMTYDTARSTGSHKQLFPTRLNNQTVLVARSDFTPDTRSIGILVAKTVAGGPNRPTITVRQSAFRGRQVAPPPTTNGAIVVMGTIQSTVDAEQNYWDHPLGAHSPPAKINPPGSFVSAGVNTDNPLVSVPSPIGPQ